MYAQMRWIKETTTLLERKFEGMLAKVEQTKMEVRFCVTCVRGLLWPLSLLATSDTTVPAYPPT